MTVAARSSLALLLLAAGCSTSQTSPPDAAAPRRDASVKDAARGEDAPVAREASSTRPPEDAGACTSPAFAGSPLGVRCNALVDTSGRTVLLHGLNARVAGVFDVTFTDGRLPVEAVPAFAAADAARIGRSASTRSASPSTGAGSSPRRTAASRTPTSTASPP